MAQGAFEIRRPMAALLTAAVLIVGIVAGLEWTAWAGHPVFGAQKTTPMLVSGANPPAEAPIGGMGYASILKPALLAVVTISSSKIFICQHVYRVTILYATENCCLASVSNRSFRACQLGTSS